MAITIDWNTLVINVPRTDMLLVQSNPTEIRQLDLNAFRLELKSIEASADGMAFLDNHRHNPPVTVGGVTLARVVEIINGYSVTFEDGQYAVNLVGANSNVADVTNVNQVSVRSANSAGLTYSKEIEDQSYLGARIWIDTINGVSGSQYPRGTPADPTDNYDDAIVISETRGLPKRFQLSGQISTSNSQRSDWSFDDWLGGGTVNASIVFDSPVNLTSAIFEKITLTGSSFGKFSVHNGMLTDFSNYEGNAFNTGIGGTISLPSGGTSSNPSYSFVNCYSTVPGNDTPVVDCNNITDLQMQFRNYSGGIEIRNFSSGNMSIDMTSGHAIIDSTCTGGVIVIRGSGRVTDNSNGATIIKHVSPVWSDSEKDVVISGLTSVADTLALLQKYQENRSVIDKVNKTLIIYDDDDVTPILAFSLLDSTGTPSTDEVAEKQPI
jgi:hypothetical protein